MKQQTKRAGRKKRPATKATLSGWSSFLSVAAAGALFSGVVAGGLLSTQTLHRHGVVIDVDPATRSLSVRARGAGGRNAYTWDEHTEFLVGTAKAGPHALSRGGDVVIHYRGGFAVTPLADRVQLTPPGAAPAASPELGPNGTSGTGSRNRTGLAPTDRRGR